MVVFDRVEGQRGPWIASRMLACDRIRPPRIRPKLSIGWNEISKLAHRQ